uniref:Uncharacterized protein n=1 Tax=Triticum aestivum TaxID=4565 RepID=A0A080YTS8_WHEAT|nr:unnamed protein product [Triticum aestivum]
MEQGRGAAVAAHGDVVEGAETAADAVQEVAVVGGAGDAAPAVAGSVPAAADLVAQGVVGSDSIVADLVVTVSEASDKQVVDVNEEAAGNKRKLDIAGFDDPFDSDDNEEYNSGDEVEEWNHRSFIEHDAKKIREKGKAAYFKWGKFRMDELNGEIVCTVEKWCKLVAALSSGQRARVADTTLCSMLQIPSIKMRTLLIRYMIENFDASKSRLIIQEQVGEVTLGAVDVECIFNLENQGLSASDILIEEGEDMKERYLYWEKVHPVEGDCVYNPNFSVQPLMRNWTKGAATRRDQFDYDNGRGRGNVKRLLEKMNKSGVMYKPAAAVPSVDNDVDQEVDSSENALFSEIDEPEGVADELTPEIIDAAISFVELASSTDKNKGKKVYYSEGCGISLTSERIRPVIDAYMGHLELSVGHDRYLCPAWRYKFLVDRAIARDDPLPSSCNMDSALSKAGAVNRVTQEYTVRDKVRYVYVYRVEYENAHWMTVVMHMIKKEFQVLDSLYPMELTEKTVKALRMAITNDMRQANLITPGKYPDDDVTSEYVEWVDGEWDSKAKSVIKYLAMKNKKLETKITECEVEIKRNEKEKRAMVKMHKEILLYRDMILGFGGLMYLGLLATIIAVIVTK